MPIKGDVNGASTTNVCIDGGKNNRKGKKYQKGNEEMLPDPTPSEALTSHPPSNTKESNEEMGEDTIDAQLEKNVSKGWKWQSRLGDIRPAHDCGRRKVQGP